ncbi:MAG: EAL domain-containing protein [Gammaproteobacteria bacterium]|nr:MAG: EAL domain-containing protein [Gammaproteobacteria bacterium]
MASSVSGSPFPLVTLRARLLVLVVLTVLPVLAILVYTGLEQRRVAADDAQEHAALIARLVADDYRRLLDDGRQRLSLLAAVPQVADADPGSCPALLARFLHKDDARFANFGVIGRDGRVRCSAVPVKGPVSTADRPYFRRALETRTFAVGEFQIGRITRAPVLVQALPVLDASGAVKSMVFAAVKLAWLGELARGTGLPEGVTVTALDARLTILARYPDSGNLVGERVPEGPLARHLAAPEKTGVEEFEDLDGVRRLLAFVRLDDRPAGPGLLVAVGVPVELAYARAAVATQRNHALLAFITTLALATAWLGADRFVLRRLDAVTAAARRLETGDLAARTGLPKRDDEIGQLAGAFDGMAETLAQQVTRVAALNRVYTVISRINGAIMRLRDKDALLNEACRTAVEAGGFRLAWIGLPDPKAGEVRPVVQAGEGAAYLDGLRIALDVDTPEGRGPVATALREGQTQVCNDIEHNPRMTPWRERARAFGLRSLIALPLRLEGKTVGAFNLYAPQSGFFDQQEVRLLEELAADTSLGLERIEKAQQLSHLANYDTLTGLPNRTLFEDRLHQALARARHTRRPVAALAVRLENVRQVSGALGRHVGDALLREVGARLAVALRPGDTVARLSGANFGVILADLARSQDVTLVVRRLLDDIPEALVVEKEKVVLALRVGVAVYPADGEDGEALLRNAELALHEASEESAEHLAFYSAELGEQTKERHRIEQELHGAIERGELALHYQPVVELATRRAMGLEALLRWESPALGAVPPDKFIPVAEQTGLIVPLGEWVIETACRQAMRWADAGFARLRVAVNVSARQLHDMGFVERARTALQRAGYDPKRAALALEITESELMHDPEQAIDLLKQLKELGLLVYVDDFGTGYSSLNYLRRLPVDVLKIDQSFVRDLGKAPETLTVVKAIVALAGSLGLEVVAEGVETRQQRDILRKLRCRLGQGYFFSRPQPAEDIEALLNQAKPRKR